MIFRIMCSIMSPTVLIKMKKILDGNQIVLPTMDKDAICSGSLVAITQIKDIDSILKELDLLKNEYNFLFYMIADAIDARESIPMGNARRMVKIAEKLGKKISLHRGNLWILEHACVLRDIGKVLISNDILLKKTVLTYDEWVLLKSHAQLGADLLREFNIFPEIAEVIASHHESYDGDGYPLGLEGESIPFLSRILKVLDVYCAMTSPRVYREGFATKEEALNHLKEERGKHFDPDVVDAFLEIDIEDI